MERKSITTSRETVPCDVCGRTLLRGEHADPFIANGSRRMVCELCTARAANEGWIREGADNALGVRRNGPRGGRSLLERLIPRRDGAARSVPAVPPRRSPSTNVARIEAGGRSRSTRLAEADADGDAGAQAEARAPLEPTPAAADAQLPREPRHVHAIPTNADLKMARALDVFNLSAHPRRISGVARSLGVP
jgi:hypothetical protein